MYSAVHGTVSAIVGVGTAVVTGSNELGFALGVASHYLVDKWAEASIFTTFTEAVIKDTVLLTSLIALSWYLIYGIWGLIFVYAGLACDLFDKGRRVMNKPEILPCHRPGFTYWYYLTEKQTKDTMIIATLFSVVLGLFSLWVGGI
jgi:hypothetical protein